MLSFTNLALRRGTELLFEGVSFTIHSGRKVGFIGAVKNLKIHRLPKLGSTLETTITVTNNFGNIILFKAEVISGGKLMAESEMSIFTQDEN